MNFLDIFTFRYSVKENLIGEVIRIPVGKRRIPIEKVDDFAQLLNLYFNLFCRVTYTYSITTLASLINGKDRKFTLSDNNLGRVVFSIHKN